MVGSYTDPRSGPSVTMVMQFDPEGELPAYGVKAVRLSESEAENLANLLLQASGADRSGR
jgi:hypothetical protein